MSKDIYIDTYGRSHVASKVLSSGGQGVIYRTEEPDTLLKLEWDPNTQIIVKDTSHNYKFNNIRLLPIHEKTNITLPQTILKDVAGYTMKLLDEMESFEKSFSGEDKEMPNNKWLNEMENSNPDLESIFKSYIASGGMRKRFGAYLEAACILAKIHMSGLVYCDVSDKNMFVSSHKDKTNVWLIDCDNLDYMKNTIKNGGWRTPGFGAPEIIRGKGNTMYSDAYSFAIALFWTLVMKHPFMGEAVEEALREKDFLDTSEEDFACSGEFPWIEDDKDNSNCSDVGLPYNLFINEELRGYFQKTFSEVGRYNRQKRTTMSEWAYILAKEYDRTVRCSNCQMDYNGKDYIICPWCDHKNKLLNVTSYKKDLNKEIVQWKFIHELQKDIKIPLRILEGFCSDHIQEIAFVINYIDNEIEIKELNTQYNFYIFNNEKKKPIYGTTKILIKDFIEIKAEKNNCYYWIKIEV